MRLNRKKPEVGPNKPSQYSPNLPSFSWNYHSGKPQGSTPATQPSTDAGSKKLFILSAVLFPASILLRLLRAQPGVTPFISAVYAASDLVLAICFAFAVYRCNPGSPNQSLSWAVSAIRSYFYVLFNRRATRVTVIPTSRSRPSYALERHRKEILAIKNESTSMVNVILLGIVHAVFICIFKASASQPGVTCATVDIFHSAMLLLVVHFCALILLCFKNFYVVIGAVIVGSVSAGVGAFSLGLAADLPCSITLCMGLVTAFSTPYFFSHGLGRRVGYEDLSEPPVSTPSSPEVSSTTPRKSLFWKQNEALQKLDSALTLQEYLAMRNPRTPFPKRSSRTFPATL